MRPKDVPARTLWSDEEIRARVTSDPEVQRRIAEARAAKEPGSGPGMTGEALQDFCVEDGTYVSVQGARCVDPL